jgi:hypothetical protein
MDITNQPPTEDGTIKTRLRLRQCLAINALLFVCIVCLICAFGDSDNPYLRFGPGRELQPLGVKIDTWTKYWMFQVLICIIKVTDVYIGEIANPILGFSVYNPDKKVITDFSKNELQLYANGMWMITSLRSVMMVMISISQIDVALLQVLYGELTSLYTIRLLLNEKSFPKDGNYKPVPTSTADENL